LRVVVNPRMDLSSIRTTAKALRLAPIAASKNSSRNGQIYIDGDHAVLLMNKGVLDSLRTCFDLPPVQLYRMSNCAPIVLNVA